MPTAQRILPPRIRSLVPTSAHQLRPRDWTTATARAPANYCWSTLPPAARSPTSRANAPEGNRDPAASTPPSYTTSPVQQRQTPPNDRAVSRRCSPHAHHVHAVTKRAARPRGQVREKSATHVE